MDYLHQPSGMSRSRVSIEKRRKCLYSFSKGNGYKKTARILGLNAYTVREYLRRYKAGDITWSERGGDPFDDE